MRESKIIITMSEKDNKMSYNLESKGDQMSTIEIMGLLEIAKQMILDTEFQKTESK